ncbi:MAG: hypothetical protein CMJ89_03900 [Planctomycetes bacterium]|nr:hypothetical protein [Planctomycetota bacterium]
MITPRSVLHRLPLCLVFGLISATAAFPQAPVAEFSATPLTGTAPLAVTFTDASTGSVTAWSWDFGDLATSILQNPSHTYPAAGTYTVALTATGPGGSDTNTKLDYISVGEPPPVADFSGTPTTGSFPLTVAFTDLSTGTPTSWAWSFGDAASSTLQNPSHTYTSIGTYTVSLTATNSGGFGVETKTGYISVTDSPPTGEFSGTPLSGVTPLKVFFSDGSTGVVTSWSWTFGDGGSSSEQNPCHIYATPGTYSVSLTVSNSGGSDTRTKLNYITVSQGPPTADFAGTPTSGATPLNTSFTDLSTGLTTSWFWDFGDLATSTLQNPSHTYSNPGAYHVSLTATGPGGLDSEIKFDYVTVSEAPPGAAFSGTPTSGIAPLSVSFTDGSTGTVTSWSWTFGDSATSIQQNPVHTYTSAGTYTVSLTAGGPGGTNVKTEPNYINVGEPVPVAEFGGAPLTGAAPVTVTFSDFSTGTISGWAWNFGDTNTTTQQNPVNTYTAAGTYTVSLAVSGPGGTDLETKVDYVTITEPAPTAEFSGTPLSGSAPHSVSFTDSSTGAVSAWSWSFGDLGTSIAQNPIHVFEDAGTYTVSLVAIGPGGAHTETKPDYVTVIAAAPAAEFSGSPTDGIEPLTVTFSDFSTGAVTGWFWNFGDSTISTAAEPTHVYAAVGTYTVSLTVSGPQGSDIETKVDYVTVVEAAPTAVFFGSPLSGIGTLAVSFLDQSTGSVSSWAWDFGDLGTSALQNPTHTYASPGTYTVKLTVTGPGGIDTETKTDYVTVSEPPPTAEFSGAPLTGSAPLPVTFTDFSTGTITSWTWAFGDGGSSSLPNPAHIYNSAGMYAVSLTVTSASGADTETKLNYVIVSPPVPSANFSALPTVGLAPTTVSFSDLSAGNITSWSWDFGDLGSSALANPTHVYLDPGTYTVRLTITGPGGVDSQVRTDYITVTNSPPDADFTAAPVTGVIPLTVNFTDLSTGVATSWSWAFGDGGTSSLQNPAHTYASAGTYTVALTASGPGGPDVESKADFIVAGEAAPVAGLSGTPLTGMAPLDVNFTDQSIGIVTAWSWDFGDLGTSTLQHPTHTYAAAGTYSVTLAAAGPGGTDSDTRTDYILVGEAAPIAQFTGTPLSGVAPLAVTFTDLTTGTISGWSWSFGDVSTSTLQNPIHVYSDPGVYTVTLSAVGPGGATTENKIDYVAVGTPPPMAEFSGTPRSGGSPLGVFFTDFSTDGVTSWSWTFGDGGNSSQQNPTHTYTTTGNYAVSLTVANIGGGDTETKLSYITVGDAQPLAEFSAGPTSGFAPLTVQFHDNSIGGVTSWSWDFGDLTTSTLQSPAHIFAAQGSYTVSLTVTNGVGIDSEVKVDYIVVTEPPPNAIFTASPRSGAAPLTVNFTDQSTGNITTWLWSFGEGGSSTLESPSHIYTLAGTYTVTLTVSSLGGVDSQVRVDYITISPPTIEDPSFEEQTPGQPPAFPWSIVSGSDHVIQPDGVASDNGMPTDAANWADVSALGTSGATPPSNPGGAGNAPLGAAGISQNFNYDPNRSVLVFDAAFLSNEPAMSAVTNDFMSVDITDGTANHNLYYADTFSAFPNTSARYGLPMTDPERVELDLTDLYPAATTFTVLTLTIQVGNAGDGLDPSRGYIDRIVPGTYAGATLRNGSGINRLLYVAPPPVLGELWLGEIDTTDHSGAGFTFIFFYAQGFPGFNVPGSGEVLVNPASPLYLVSAVPANGGVTLHPQVLPNMLHFIGLNVASQGYIIGGFNEYTNAIDIVANIAVDGPPPQASFLIAPTIGPAPLPVSFVDTSTGAFSSWNWDFGDGGASPQQNPVHVYTVPGTYTVSLHIIGPGGLDVAHQYHAVQVQ